MAQNPTISSILQKLSLPKRAVITAGMPYANGPLHLGHLAGTHIPADIFSRWLGMAIGRENVLYVCGTDDHGSTSELAALQAGKPIEEFIGEIHDQQERTLRKYSIGLDIYSGTSRRETFENQKNLCHFFIKSLYNNNLLEKRTTRQWYDPKMSRFLQDRYVLGKCPNPRCEFDSAYSDECEKCGTHYDPSELKSPRSGLSDAVPLLQKTTHWWLDMWKVSDLLCQWIRGKEGIWRTPVYHEVIHTVLPSLRFDQAHESKYKILKEQMPTHKSKYAAGKKIALQFENKDSLFQAKKQLQDLEISSELNNSWAYRSMSRDVRWGIPLPLDLDPEMKDKTLYVWPDSLIAPIAFTQAALNKLGRKPAELEAFWKDPDAKIYQFLGQDNVYFYVIMQAAMWLGSQVDTTRLPQPGEFQLTEVFGCFHLQVDGDKMSKSRGNFITGDQLLEEKGFSSDQIRYYLALLSLPEKASNFDFKGLEERNRFLAGPLNAAMEKPISAVHSKFGGKIPEGEILEKAQVETLKTVQRYIKYMEKAEYVTLLYAIENYARLINSFFTQFKPHDDRFPEKERRDALVSSFYILKNLMIMLYPFVPVTMDKLRLTLNLEPSVFSLRELGQSIATGHRIGEKQEFFPKVESGAQSSPYSFTGP